MSNARNLANLLNSSGVLTADAGLKADNITIDGTEIDLSSGDLTLDVSGDIILDADDGIVAFRDGGVGHLQISNSSNDAVLTSLQNDKDLIFQGNDNGSIIEAMRIDMSVGGFVGIGTISPNNKLDVNGGIVCSPNTDGKDTFQLSTNDVDEGRLRIKNVDTTTVQIRAGGDSFFNGGSIGIGTTSIAAKLHIENGDASITPSVHADELLLENNGNTGITIGSSTSGFGGLRFADSGGDSRGNITYSHSDDRFQISTADSQVARILNNGALQVKVGSANYDDWASNASQCQINTDETSVVTFTVNAQTTSFGLDVQRLLCDRTNNSAYDFLTCTSGNLGDDEFHLRGDGNAFADGSFSGGGADYAEYFEWKDGNTSNEDRVGISVKLDGNMIVASSDSDNASDIIGVISANPAVVGDAAYMKWNEKYLRDDFGRYIREEYTVTQWQEKIEGEIDNQNKSFSYETDKIPSDVTVPKDAKVLTVDDNGAKFTRRKLNPNYDESKAYVSREDRPEWDTVGLMGKLRIKKGQKTGTNWIKMRDISDTVEEWLVR
tara:strand:+ start:62 stop:1711 length:1650 start_codon:yes stop_codon:yes gene_type:complete